MAESQGALLLRKQLRGRHMFGLVAGGHHWWLVASNETSVFPIQIEDCLFISEVWRMCAGEVWRSLEECPSNVCCAELSKHPVDGFSAGLVDDSDLFEWQVTVIGPPDTL